MCVFYGPFLLSFILHAKYISVSYTSFKKRIKNSAKEKRKLRERVLTFSFLFFKLKDRTTVIKMYECALSEKKKRFPLSLFVENCRTCRIPSVENCRMCRVGHPRWKIVIRKIPTTHKSWVNWHFIATQLLLLLLLKKRVTNFWIEYIYIVKMSWICHPFE